MVGLDRGFFDGAVLALDLAINLRVGELGQAVLPAVSAADAVKTVPAGQEQVGLRGKLNAVVGQHRARPIEQFVQHPAQ